MADPRIPHLLGITLSSNGVANTLVVAVNKSTREKMTKRTDSNKVVIFDAADFSTLYGLNTIQFNNVGSSVGSVNITIDSLTGGFQEATLTAAASPTVAVNL